MQFIHYEHVFNHSVVNYICKQFVSCRWNRCYICSYLLVQFITFTWMFETRTLLLPDIMPHTRTARLLCCKHWHEKGPLCRVEGTEYKLCSVVPSLNVHIYYMWKQVGLQLSLNHGRPITACHSRSIYLEAEGGLNSRNGAVTALWRKDALRMVSSGMLRRVTLVRTDVSEGLSASFIRVIRICELGTMHAAPMHASRRVSVTSYS
jgi:hypothetical protein